ncbi:nitroreductase [Clostridium pasteurianum DSM 525 = ATCC 6013]|uniref:Nitroreductase n=1 Tax=Clostridium pasteurianum DSM 525 = ATCC 6013 TaxID=1262449 RepID=A0A0H3J6Q6_CLOPA|nr:nitroreductase family protein [Clostridium pasteurianum]AJA46645.1 nitroreductase [Clostridium pasteurianum DSM 525 = ATCC 6013]AJA50633.1 nitroreductase [Clostridium pasteurianum DSM 525 = ATCC 6013]AOZ74056.1 nitroreductase [Clostridium pasteurianum DSM 525 = ATCC 6013]AOZ77853.1 nitroreductase [Clostridium pasteurianum]ELP61210.1 nitroreductase [Clostridium pasteurianum DSM 525 = ATCC 6013]
MDTIRAINERRSIRSFKSNLIPAESIEKLLEIATKSPSAKNRQPWRFVVLQGNKKDKLVEIMTNTAKDHREKGLEIGSLELSTNSINESSTIILVFNAFSNTEKDYNRHKLLVDTQSIGAAIENMILGAEDMGLATLWICDIFYSDKDICDWLDKKEELVAAVAIGYGNQHPHKRPRKDWREITEW